MIDHEYADAYYNMGIIYNRFGQKQRASECFDMAYRLKPELRTRN